MEDIERKSSFDKLWKQKYNESKYRFELAGLFSNRRVQVGDVITCVIYGSEDRTKLKFTVIDKPSYIDSFSKVRYRGWLRCREVGSDDGQIIVANVTDIMYLERGGKNIKF